MKSIFSYESSKVSWCETNYQVSSLICEFMNTITGLFYIYYAIRYYYDLKLLFGDEFRINNIQNLNSICKKSIMTSIIACCIGIFTMYFHGTLSFSGQLLDEYSIYLLIMILDYENNFNIFVRLVSGFLIMNISTLYNRLFLFSYGFYRSITLFQKYLNEKDYRMKRIFSYGNFLFFSSLVCWVVDEFWCDKLLISIHWLWHILSSASFYYIANYLTLFQIRQFQVRSNFDQYLSLLCFSIPLPI